MGILTPPLAPVAMLAVLAGCYSPQVRDCTVSCEAPTDCASGQICGTDGMCAAPSVAGHCDPMVPDAGARPDAALPQDAAAGPPDAPATVKLRVQVTGRGSVAVDGRGVCSSQDPQRGDCTYDVPVGVAQRARAIPIQLSETFESWTSPTCSGSGPICVFTPGMATTIAARFHRN